MQRAFVPNEEVWTMVSDYISYLEYHNQVPNVIKLFSAVS
jgi:hypothetical protein